MILGSRSSRIPAGVQLYVLLTGFMAAVYLLGTHGIGLSRPLFIAGCAGLSWFALRLGTGYQIETAIVIFAFAPFLRRVVDYSCGFDPSGTMLLGPLLVMIVPTLELPGKLLAQRTLLKGLLAPYVIMMLCFLYGLSISMATGMLVGGFIILVKVSAATLYGVWLMTRAENDRGLIRSAARAFAIVTPIIGAYGIAQYLNPSAADRYWMTMSRMSVIGVPEPRQVRVFSTMNSPASFGNFAVCGLVLIGFLYRGWVFALLAFPICLSILLSLYRTSWIGLVACVFWSLLFNGTRARGTAFVSFVAVGAIVALVATPFGEVLVKRLSTFGSLHEDGSGAVRLLEIERIYTNIEDHLIGGGLAFPNAPGVEKNNVSVNAADGLIVSSVLALGIPMGTLYMFAVAWAAMQGLGRVWRPVTREDTVVGALIVGQLIQMPLSSGTGAEFGVIFWMTVAIAATAPTAGLVLSRRILLRPDPAPAIGAPSYSGVLAAGRLPAPERL